MSENGGSIDVSADGVGEGENGPELEGFRSYLHVLAESQLHRSLKAKVDASDIVQQTMLQAYQAKKQFRGTTEAEMAAWLRTILTNVLYASAREYSTQSRDITREKAAASVEQSSVHLANLLTATTSSPSAPLHRSEKSNQIARAMLGLTGEQRQAIMMKYWNGATLAEIGEEMGRTTEAVAGLLFRGMQKLKQELGRITQSEN